MKKESEFGKGFIYNLVLFAQHYWFRMERDDDNYRDKYWMWFNGASDHLYELEIPKQWERKKLGKLAKKIQDTALDLGHGMDGRAKCTEKAKTQIFDDLQELCLLIDKELGVESIEADHK